MGNKLDIVNNRSKILSVLKAVFLLLRVNHWMTRFDLWNLLVTAVLFVRQFASVLVKVVMQKLCLLQQLRSDSNNVKLRKVTPQRKGKH